MSNVAARQRSEKNAMLQGDGQVDHRSNPRRPLRGPEALIDTSPCTLGTGCSNCASPHRYNVSPLLGERMQAIDRNYETDLKSLDLKPLTELRPADRIAPQGRRHGVVMNRYCDVSCVRGRVSGSRLIFLV
jgi:hypothetical protein